MQKPQPMSSPAVYEDKVYRCGNRRRGRHRRQNHYPAAALLCFKANPDFVIRVTQSAGFDAAVIDEAGQEPDRSYHRAKYGREDMAAKPAWLFRDNATRDGCHRPYRKFNSLRKGHGRLPEGHDNIQRLQAPKLNGKTTTGTVIADKHILAFDAGLGLFG